MRELFGYWLPWQYAAGPEAEHLATREKVTVCDLDYMAEFRIQGAGAYEFVQQLLTNDFSDMAVGQVRYTAMCKGDGNMVDDGTLWRLGDEEFVVITGQDSDGDWISSQAAGFDVKVANLTDSWTTLAVQGPDSRELVEALVSDDRLYSLRYYRFIRIRMFDEDCIVARMGYTGELGYEFHVHPRAADRLWRALLQAGSDMGVLPLGQAGLESLRQEAGYLLVGNDHDGETNPLEAGIGHVVKLDKSTFNGRDALAVIRRDGVERTLVWLRLDDDTAPETGARISIDGSSVGLVTSGSYSPSIRRGVAMGYVDPRHAIPGILVAIATEGGDRGARLSLMPLYDPSNVRTRSNSTRESATTLTPPR